MLRVGSHPTKCSVSSRRIQHVAEVIPSTRGEWIDVRVVVHLRRVGLARSSCEQALFKIWNRPIVTIGAA